jgi:hypothetical protein
MALEVSWEKFKTLNNRYFDKTFFASTFFSLCRSSNNFRKMALKAVK